MRAVCLLPAQASSQSMPWLADLVQSSEGSLDVLPVQCLCEFLLHDAAAEPASGGEEEEGESRERRARKRQVSLRPGPRARPDPVSRPQTPGAHAPALSPPPSHARPDPRRPGPTRPP